MSSSSRRRTEAIQQIEAAITTFLQELTSTSTSATTAIPSLRLGASRPLPAISTALRDTKRLAVVLRVLELVHQALVDNVVTTKRDIYYKDSELFGNQRVVDRVIDHLAACFKTTRAGLNVAAAAKGLVVGAFSVRRRDANLLSCNEREAQLVPVLEEYDVLDVGLVDWVLVVEKEATFSALVSAGLVSLPDVGRGIMITGKGYPDISTRAFLRRLAMSYPRGAKAPTLLALVDHDPDGIAIMSTYKHGSEALSHESRALVAPQLQWLGVKREDLVRMSTSLETGEELGPERGLLRLTKRDRAKAMAMLEKGVCAEDGVEAGWRAELQAMLMTNVKAEIQLLDGRAGGLVGWLALKLAEHGQSVLEDDRMLV